MAAPLLPPGAKAEALAAEFLTARGLAIIARNWRTRCGEVDLIAQDGEVLVFVEVRLRRNARFGGAGASITRAKCTRIVAAASHYLARLAPPPPCRFDAVLLDALDTRRIVWLRDVIAP